MSVKQKTTGKGVALLILFAALQTQMARAMDDTEEMRKALAGKSLYGSNEDEATPSWSEFKEESKELWSGAKELANGAVQKGKELLYSAEAANAAQKILDERNESDIPKSTEPKTSENDFSAPVVEEVPAPTIKTSSNEQAKESTNLPVAPHNSEQKTAETKSEVPADEPKEVATQVVPSENKKEEGGKGDETPSNSDNVPSNTPPAETTSTSSNGEIVPPSVPPVATTNLAAKNGKILSFVDNKTLAKLGVGAVALVTVGGITYVLYKNGTLKRLADVLKAHPKTTGAITAVVGGAALVYCYRDAKIVKNALGTVKNLPMSVRSLF